MSKFKDAALKILQESKHPMTPTDIYQNAAEQQLIKTSGKTPESTMAAQLYMDIKKKGPSSKFVHVGKGLFAAATKSNKEKAPEQIILEYNDAQKIALKERLMSMDPYIFERLIGDLLGKLGYENVFVTKRSGDGGIDVKADLTIYGFTNVKTAVQVKRYSQNVSDKVVRELRGAAEVDQRGLIITTADFTSAAKKEASAINKMPISLVNGERLVELLIKYRIGIKVKMTEMFSLNEEYFDSLEGLDHGSLSEKKKGIWPLPGGIDHYYDSLLDVLEALKEKPLTKESLVNWFKSRYESVNSEKTIASYMSNVFASLGLVQFIDKKYKLTAVGENLLKNPSRSVVFELFNARIFGIEDAMSLVENSEAPITDNDLRSFMVDNFDVNWSTNLQASFRLLWLWNLGKIQRTEDGKYCKI